MIWTASMIQTATLGTLTLYGRRLSVATKTLSGIAGTMAPPVLWVLLIAPALDDALGGFNLEIDYYTYVAVAQVALIVPFTSMFSGINVIVDKEFGILREFLVAPVFRASIPLANALAVLTIASVQVALIIGLGTARGAEFDTSPTGVVWFGAAVALLSLTTYAVAEVLALAVGRQEAFGPLIPAVGRLSAWTWSTRGRIRRRPNRFGNRLSGVPGRKWKSIWWTGATSKRIASSKRRPGGPRCMLRFPRPGRILGPTRSKRPTGREWPRGGSGWRAKKGKRFIPTVDRPWRRSTRTSKCFEGFRGWWCED